MALRASAASVAVQELLDDPSTTELQLIGHDRWFTKHGGKLVLHTDMAFSDEGEMADWLNRLLERCGSAERIDGTTYRIETAYISPSVHGRVHIMWRPVADPPTVTIAKQPSVRLGIDDLINSDTASPEMMGFIAAAVAGHLNIVVAGATGAGKTTALNAVASLCDPSESIVVIQEVPELFLSQANVKYLYSRAVRSTARAIPPDVLIGLYGAFAMEMAQAGAEVKSELNFEGFTTWLGHHLHDAYQSGFYSPVGLDALVKETLRMRPDRIIVGEVRGSEAAEMLEVMGSGHEGMSTIHANGPLETLDKLKMLVMRHESHPTPHYAAELVAKTIDLVIYLNRPEMGQHRVGAIMEVDPTVVGETTITHQVLFEFDRQMRTFRQIQQPSRRLKERLGSHGVLGAL